MKRFLPMILLALLVPATAQAEIVVPDPAAQSVTTLGGTIVWVSGAGPGQTLMMRSADGAVAPVKAPAAAYYRNLDLGRDADGKPLLTYARCSSVTSCVHLWDDLDGRRASFRHLPFKDCELSTTPARWKTRVVFGLGCFERVDGKRVFDAARSGLYARTGNGKRIRLTAPRDVRRTGSNSITWVDIRGSNVAAIYADIAAFAVLRGVAAGSPATALRVAASEGDSDQHARRVVLAGTTTLFAHTDSSYGGDPAQSILHRQTANCADYQIVKGSSETESPILDIAADGTTEYVIRPGVGIEAFDYEPDVGC